MKRKTIDYIIVIMGFLSVCAILYYIFISGLFSVWMNFFKKDIVSPVAEVSVQNNLNNEDTATDKPQVKKTISFDANLEDDNIEKENVVNEFSQDDLVRIGFSFAERFGSYSNQSNFSNIDDLKIYMTEKMKAWSDDFVFKARGAGSDSQDYFGIITKAVGSEVIEFDEEKGVAKIMVMCRRREAQDSITNVQEVYPQNVVVMMKKEYGAWKVDEAFWEEVE